MAHGIRILNPSGEIVLSSDTYFPVYLGKATVQSTTQPSAVGNATTGTGTGGASFCTFNYAGQIVPVLALPPGYSGAIFQCTQSGSTWTMKVSYSDGSTINDVTSPAAAMRIQFPPEVFVFGFPTSLGGTWGGAIWRADGSLVGDLTRRPLMVAQRVHLPQIVNSVSVTALTKPGIVGRAMDTVQVANPTGTPNVLRVLRSGTIFAITGTTLARVSDRRKLQNTGGEAGDFSRKDAVNLWLTECAGLT
jgi:hypothetical protein